MALPDALADLGQALDSVGAALPEGPTLERARAALTRARTALTRVKARTGPAAQRGARTSARTQLLERVLQAQEDERLRISRDLHDDVCQPLASLLLRLHLIEQAESLGEVRAHCAELTPVAAAAAQAIRRIARGLRPPLLDDLGLAAAVEQYAADFGRAHGIDVTVDVSGLSATEPGEAASAALYRIAQEGLANVARHADARTAHVILKARGDTIELTLSDSGRGFDTRALRRAGSAGRLGIVGMRERAALLNGRLDVRSRPGRGTKLRARIPLNGKPNGEAAHPDR